jgi:branched-chain amino acid transport system ATP-binding protein
MLSVDGVTAEYGQVTALRGISLSVAEGEVVAVLGPNGAGKSTLLAAITGIKPVSQGAITFLDKPIARESPEKIVRRGIALVPEGRRIFGSLTVHENLVLGATVRTDKKAAAADMDDVLRMFPILAEYRQTTAGRLSGGEQQQLAIARALLTRPRLLLLDEPSLGLAPLVVKLVYEKLSELRAGGMTILLVEQSVELALTIAQRVYILRSGAIAFEGSAISSADRETLERAYFGYGTAEVVQ